MLKKPYLMFSSCNGSFPTFPNVASTSKTSSCPRQTTSVPFRGPRRNYAMVSNGYSQNSHKTLPWPEVTLTHRIPSPYQIFQLKKGQPYTKKKYYELVKLYHPDRHDKEIDGGISYETKLERYRLIVAAHKVLSCPVKRSAYDTYGAGWNGQPEVMSPHENGDGNMEWGGYAARGWQGGPAGPSQNATWEDWERWYGRDAKGKQEPLYVSNKAFVSLIVMFAALGGIGQATRMGNYSASFVEQVDALHDDISKDLMRRRNQSVASGSREERVLEFLKHRESTDHGTTSLDRERYQKAASPPEIGSRANIEAQQIENHGR